MRARPVIALLLIIAVTIAATARTLVQRDDPPVETNDAQLTPDEEWEARSIAEQFTRRFEESDDLLSIVDDLYVKDFNDRLRHDPADRFIVPIAPELALQIKGDELRRCHIATLKFSYLYTMLLYGAWQSANHLNGNAQPRETDREPDPEEVLPPRVISVLRNDPAFAEMLLEASKNRSEASGAPEEQAGLEDSEQKAEDHDVTIKDIERLRSYVSTLEQALPIMREHLQTLPVPQTWQSLMDSMSESGQDPDHDPMHPRIVILAQDSFGCPKGTRLISVNVLQFHMDLIRVDGQLRVLNVYLEGD